MTANRVRIIGGRYRSRILRFTPRPDLRPTPDRVRETLFNWLGQDLSGQTCLDLFAGSGALGFEAVSRGAENVVMVERDARVFRALADNARALGCLAAVDLVHGDAIDWLRTTTRMFEVVFLDPPFSSDMLSAVVPLLARVTRNGGMIYIESTHGVTLAGAMKPYRQGVAGQVTYQLFIHGNQ